MPAGMVMSIFQTRASDVIDVKIRLLWKADDSPEHMRENDLVKSVKMPCLPPVGTGLYLDEPGSPAGWFSDTVTVADIFWDERSPEEFELETELAEVGALATDFRALMFARGWSEG